MNYNNALSDTSGGFLLGFGLFSFVLILLNIIGMWKIFVKAGKPGWASLVPIYNSIVLIEIVGKPTIWILWLLIPCTAPIFSIWLLNLLSKSFGKTESYTVGLVLLSFIFIPMLGFGSAQYLGPSAAEAQRFNGFGGNDPFNQPPATPQ
ncbi:hypothetical protein AQ505_24925 [Pedobacter sp. PACM 27299]|uniref:DUF5684 domain-containing protein n=1 Tax=Pedobacter sp. PACM 27299 TaxID=1727164 RepID=UPI000706ACB1|nr:DUF5684 domain-containing protein [Pedobacter sp. PACM 27299]ALL08429.1 hypothetical protein AQ505_24925 [Pedobacter sp. PACM 27299]